MVLSRKTTDKPREHDEAIVGLTDRRSHVKNALCVWCCGKESTSSTVSSPLWLLIRVVKRALDFLSPFYFNRTTKPTNIIDETSRKYRAKTFHSFSCCYYFAFCLLDFYVLSILVLMVGKKSTWNGFFLEAAAAEWERRVHAEKRNMLKVSIAVAFDCCDISLTNSQQRVNILQLMSTHSSCCCPILAITIGWFFDSRKKK